MSVSRELIKNGLFLFRRDFRIEDNLGFIEAAKKITKSKGRLYCAFIFTPEQISSKKNPYKSDTCVKFMIESLQELDRSLKSHGGELLCFYGENSTVLKKLIPTLEIDAIFFNEDYTPFSRERDAKIRELCKKNNILCEMFQDYYLYKPGTILSGSGTAYKKFAPFYEKVLPMDINKPIIRTKAKDVFVRTGRKLEHRITLTDALRNFIGREIAINQIVNGGRELALRQLSTAKKTQQHYDRTRDTFSVHTSLLSAYLKFGCVSVREVYWTFRDKFGLHAEILRQLIWREFYAHILYAYPEMINARKNNRHSIQWNKNQNWFRRWCEGNTGFPIVDASMRQLNQTGWMHNRGRLVVSIFLVKVLLIDWRWGEQYFATKLVDYDIASNNGNWQWVASTGADNMPYFRTMNPWTQAIKHDPECTFIKQWVPELGDLDKNTIHQWDSKFGEPENRNIQYPKPMVDFSEQRLKSLALYKKYL